MYRGKAKTEGLRSYALFVAFFPQLIAGPIVRYQEIVPQLRSLSSRLSDRLDGIAIGVSFFAIGLLKKSLIADELSLYADPLFDAAGRGEIIIFAESWTAVLAFGFQIYFDFS